MKKCDCGVFVLQGHVIKYEDIIDGKAPCVSCHRYITVNNNAIMGGASLKISTNGSYILPNGIVVLVDEDVEAYFNGTLIFYDYGETPLTS